MERTNTQAVRRAAVLLLGLLVVISVFCGAAAAADSNLVSNVTLHSTGDTGTPASVSADGSAAGGSDWGSVTVQNCLRGHTTYVSGPTETLTGAHNEAALSTTYSGLMSVRGASVKTNTIGAESTFAIDIDGSAYSLSYQALTLDPTQTSWTYTHPGPVVKATVPTLQYGINLFGQTLQTANFAQIPAMTSSSSDANKNTVTDSHVSASTAGNAQQTFSGTYGIYVADGAVSGSVVTGAASASSYLYLPGSLTAANAAGDSIEVMYHGIQNIQGASIKTASGTGTENTLKLDPDGSAGLQSVDITTNRSDTDHHYTFPTPANLAITNVGLSASNALQSSSKTYSEGISIQRMSTAVESGEYDNVVKDSTISGSTRDAGYGFAIPSDAPYLMPEDTAVNVDTSSSSAVYGKAAEGSISAAVTEDTPKVTFTFNPIKRQGASVKTASVGAAGVDITLILDSARAADTRTLAIDGTSPYVYYYGGLGPFTPTASYPVAALANVNVPITPSSITVTNVANIVSATTVTAGGTAKAGNWDNNDGTEAAAQGIQTTKTDSTDIATGSITEFTYVSGTKATYEIDPDDASQRIYTAVNVRGSIVRIESNAVKAGLTIDADISPVPYTGSIKDVVYAYDEESGISSLSFKQPASLVDSPENLKLYNEMSAIGVTLPFTLDTAHSHDGVVFSDVLNKVDGITAGDYSFTANGRYYLGSNLKLRGTLTVPAGVDVKICLNGYTITANESKPAFNVNGGKLTIYADGVSKVGTIAANGNAEAVIVTSGEFTLNSGTLKAASYDAVKVDGGSFTMNGGTVTNATVSGKYGVNVGNGASSFTFTGGKVTGNDKGISSAININVSGTPAVSGNTNGNIALASGKVLNLIGALKTGAALTVDGADSTYASADLTTGWSAYMKEVSGTEPYRYIKSTAAGYIPYVTDAGEIRFAEGGLKGDYEIIENGTTQLSGGQGFSLDTANAVYYLSRDVILEDGLKVTADGVTLYLNGYTLTAASGKPAINVTAGTLAIGDSSAALGGTVIGNGAAAVYVDGGTLTLNSGNIEASGANPALMVTAGTAEIAGGIVKAASSNAVTVTGGELKVTGGTVDGNSAAADAVTVTGTAELTVTGGKITRSGTYGINYNGAADGFTFTGGTISGNAKGIYSAANISIKDAPAAAGNTEGNIYLAEGKFLNLTGALTKAASISMNLTETAASEEHIFTVHWSEYMGTASEAEETRGTQPHHYILSDARGFNAVASEDGLEVIIKEGGVGGSGTHYHNFGTADEIIFDQILNSASNVKAGDVILTRSGNYTLNADLQLKGNITIPEGVTVLLCLDGFKLTAEENRNLFDVKGNLTLFDCRENSAGGVFGNLSTTAVTDHSGNGAAVYVDGGNFILESGIIKDFTGNNGAAVYVNTGKFTAKGGKITGNTAAGNGAVYIKNGAVFNVEGTPVIKGNTAENIHLETGAVITISGELKDGAELHINASAGAAAGTAFTSGWETAMSEKDPAAYIKADSGNLIASLTGTAPGREVWFSSVEPKTVVLLKGTTVEFADGSRFGYDGINGASIDVFDRREEGMKGLASGYNISSGNLVLTIPKDFAGDKINLSVAGNKVEVGVIGYDFTTGAGGTVNESGVWESPSLGVTPLTVNVTMPGTAVYFGLPTVMSEAGVPFTMNADDVKVYKDGTLLTKDTGYTINTEFDGRKEIVLTNPSEDSLYTYKYEGAVFGDISTDGLVLADDASLLGVFLAAVSPFDSNDLIYCDINKNGMLDLADIRLVAQYAAYGA